MRSVKAHLWGLVFVAGLGAVLAAVVLPVGDRAVMEVAVGFAALLCVAAAIGLHRPEDRSSWILLGAGLGCWFAADLAAYLERTLDGQSLPYPSAWNGVTLAGYVLVLVAVVRLSRNPSRRHRRDDYADASVVTIAAVALLWYYVLGPRVHDTSMGSAGVAVVVLTTVMDIALVYVLFWMLVSGLPLHSSRGLVAAALLALVGADFAAGVAVVHGLSPEGGLVTAGYVLAFVLIAVAALHPSVAEPLAFEPARTPNVYHRDDAGRHRLPLVAVAGIVPVTILLVTSTDGSTVDVTFMAAAALAVTGLLYVRMTWMIGRISGQADELEGHARALEASHRQRDALEDDLRHLAFHDELTGLANRALLHDRVEHALASLPRAGRTVALCFGDLDGFKTVNDTLGHDVGDRLLRRTSRLLSSIVRPGDTVARLGGDEFAVLMVDVDREQAAIDFAHRIVSVLSRAPDFEGQPVGLSISVGVAFAEPGKSTEQFLTEADSAMYEAKEKGKNRVEVFESSMRSRMLERLEMANGFRWALGRSELFLQYQPIVSLSDWSLHGFEALVRWSHPSLGLLRPLQFVPIAEETGFIVPLGRWVLT
ncbi:MAG: diguanylate cyclase, partial [Acidimicrobiales bacterium]|nr:diguanylate cyclase [Acidimicrobiales bacterium]